MKRFVFLLIAATISFSVMAQTERTKKNLEIYKPTPTLYINSPSGVGGVINWGNGDILLTHTANKLAFTGGTIDFSVLPTVGGASLSALYTAGNISIGANSLLLTGSVGATGAGKATKLWSVDAEFTNLPTISGTSIHTNALFTGNTGIGTAAVAYHKLSVIAATSTNLNAFNVTNSDVNKARTTAATASDSSSFNVKFTATGSPTVNVIAKNGTAIMTIDSLKILAGVPIKSYNGDTTVTKIPGLIVYKTSDSTLYVCRYTRPTGKNCWWALDH
jgi:hypothetical protein